MTKQDLFDRVVSHFATMPGPAMNRDGDCCYRNRFGERCFVGALLTDEAYRPVADLVEGYPLILTDPADETYRSRASAKAGELLREALGQSLGRELHSAELELLSDLQRVHDRWDEHKDRGTVIEQLRQTASEHGLSTGHLDALEVA